MVWAHGERITSPKPLVVLYVLAQRPAKDVGNEGARLRVDCGRHIVAGLPDDSLFVRTLEPALLSTRPTSDTNRPHHRTGGRQEAAELMRSRARHRCRFMLLCPVSCCGVSMLTDCLPTSHEILQGSRRYGHPY
jgi:hypothetical protein